MNEKRKEQKLAGEILRILAISFVAALFLLQFLGLGISSMVDRILVMKGIFLTEAQFMILDDWVFHISLLASVAFFVVFFLALLGERLSYIKEIMKGIHALREGKLDYTVPLERNNELTRLAEAVNYLSLTQRQVKEKEQAFYEEREQFIRMLSHDIRTPLTSILAYSEFLLEHRDCSADEYREQLLLIQKKGRQMKELTDVLLEGGKRNLEFFEDARLLMTQLAAEFEEMLEEDFSVFVDLSACTSFSTSFDVQELRRIFDNLISNIQKYADPMQPVILSIGIKEKKLVIQQSNAVGTVKKEQEGYQIGLNSIRRIVHGYGGGVEIQKNAEVFQITITFSEF